MKKHDRNAKLVLFAKKVGRICQRICSLKNSLLKFSSDDVPRVTIWRGSVSKCCMKTLCQVFINLDEGSEALTLYQGSMKGFRATQNVIVRQKKVCYLHWCLNQSCLNAS